MEWACTFVSSFSSTTWVGRTDLLRLLKNPIVKRQVSWEETGNGKMSSDICSHLISTYCHAGVGFRKPDWEDPFSAGKGGSIAGEAM